MSFSDNNRNDQQFVSEFLEIFFNNSSVTATETTLGHQMPPVGVSSKRTPAAVPAHSLRIAGGRHVSPSPQYSSSPPPRLPPKSASSCPERAHIFIDLSNIVKGARNVGSHTDLDMSIFLNPRGLIDVVRQGRVLDEGWVVGSTPAENSSIWEQFRAAGLKTDFVPLVNGKEDRVDETLHADVQDTILREMRTASDRTIILLSGDGNENHQRKTSFPTVLKHALNAGYKVEVWSWQRCTSGVYREWQRTGVPNFSLVYLDGHRGEVTCKGSASQSHHVSSVMPHVAPVKMLSSYPVHGAAMAVQRDSSSSDITSVLQTAFSRTFGIQFTGGHSACVRQRSG